MTDLTRARTFGPEFEQLLTAAYRCETDFIFQLDTRGRAQVMRMQLYKYFRQLRKENLRLDLIEMADSLKILADGETLVITKQKDTWESKVIRARLNLSEDFVAGAAPHEGHASDLLGNRLSRKLEEVRARMAGELQEIVQPFNPGK
jgi:hypothetical protein